MICILNSNVSHSPYYVIIPDDFKNPINTYYYLCDGFYADEYGIIIIEYDGKIFHNLDTDKARDYQIMSIDKSIIGVIRIKESVIKYLNTINQKFNDAIQKIKNSKENRIFIE